MKIQELKKSGNCMADIQWLKEHLVCRLVNRKNNEKLLKYIPYRNFYDLAVICYVPMTKIEDRMYFSIIRKEQMEALGLDEESLFSLALENTRKLFPIRFTALEQVIRQAAFDAGLDVGKDREEDFQLEQEAGGMYILSNTSTIYGAVAMIYPDVWEAIADELQSDLFILPSSCHELLVLPHTEQWSVLELADMVFTVNRDCVEPKDRLSDSVYLYRRAEKRIMMAWDAE